MAALIEKKHINDNYSITMEYTNNCYIVTVCPHSNNYTNDYMCGYPIRKMIYTINEKEKANRTFKRYVKKYIE